MPARYIVFDLDGTLVESLPGIAQAINLALQSLGRAPHPAQKVRGMIGQGASDLCAKALGATCSAEVEAELQQAMEKAFAREYAHCLDGDGTQVFPGIMQLLSKLYAAGAKLAILSNKPQGPTKRIADRLFKGVPFTHVLGFEKGRFPRKPDPTALHYIAKEWGVDTRELVLIGDSVHDAHTAKNAGSQLILLTWGYSTIKDLLAWSEKENTPIFSTVEDLSHYLLKGALQN